MAQMDEVLKSGGIDITERSLRTFLDKGVLPGRKVAEAARSMVSEEGSDPFRAERRCMWVPKARKRRSMNGGPSWRFPG